MAAGDLTTLPAALAWTGLAADDAHGTVARLITAASVRIEQFLSRTVAITDYTRTFNGRGTPRMMVPDYPISEVTGVMVDGAFVPARTANSGGYVFDENTVYLDAPRTFTRGIMNVQISYRAGYATVPADIEQACLDWVKMLLDSQNYAANVSMMRAGDHQMEFSNLITKVRGGTMLLPPSIAGILQPYARVYTA